mgnify:FL=1
MATTKELKEENQHWHEDHLQWIADIELWQQETHRLVALLYKLEKAIPEHSSKLQQHLVLIEKHEKKITQYQGGRDQRYLADGEDFVSIERQLEFYKTLKSLHNEAKQQHMELKQSYADEMETFRNLAIALLAETNKF